MVKHSLSILVYNYLQTHSVYIDQSYKNQWSQWSKGLRQTCQTVCRLPVSLAPIKVVSPVMTNFCPLVLL